MARHKWTYIGKTNKAEIYVDYRNRKTLIKYGKTKYLHEGIYPYHTPVSYRKYKK